MNRLSAIHYLNGRCTVNRRASKWDLLPLTCKLGRGSLTYLPARSVVMWSMNRKCAVVRSGVKPYIAVVAYRDRWRRRVVKICVHGVGRTFMEFCWKQSNWRSWTSKYLSAKTAMNTSNMKNVNYTILCIAGVSNFNALSNVRRSHFLRLKLS